jgi:hypothetical protein
VFLTVSRSDAQLYCGLLGYATVRSGACAPAFQEKWLRDVKSCSMLNVYRRFGGMYYLRLHDVRVRLISMTLAPCLTYSSTLKMEAVHLFETTANVYQTTRNSIPQYTVT